KSAGERLKKATSEPEIKALKRRRTAIAPMGTKSISAHELAEKKSESRTLTVGFSNQSIPSKWQV
ncbi:MAG TPA: hypothetical protein DCX00_03350, partial [Flavobacteriales bacterium]|nr:hypothetical protein [Flavobacteriales bacterium]